MSPARCLLAAASLATAVPVSRAAAHELRPAYLEIDETTPGRYRVLWWAPVSEGVPLPVVPVLPGGARDVIAPVRREGPSSVIERRVVDVAGGVAGWSVRFAGLEGTLSEVLARVRLAGGGTSTTWVRPSRPWIEIAPPRGWAQVLVACARNGIEHLLVRTDHLLFLVALVLILRRGRPARVHPSAPRGHELGP
jgi:hypothetical protein